MRLGVRGTLFLVSLGLILTGGLGTGVWLEGELRGALDQRIDRELRTKASLVATVVADLPPDAGLAEADSVADRLGRSSGTRVTLIAADGRVLGDSRLELAAVEAVENHGDRPEVVDALRQGEGQSRRWSATLQVEMLYAAVAVQSAGRGLVARVATPRNTLSREIERLRVVLGFAALLLVLLAVFMSTLASWLLERVLGQTVAQLRGVSPDAEVGQLAGSVEELSRKLKHNLAALAGERARFAAVLDSMSEAVVAVDADEAVTVVNRRALRMLGLDTTPVGQPLADVLEAPELAGLASKARQGGIVSLEFDLKGATDRRVLLRASLEGEGGGVVLVLLDVTETRHLERVRRDFVANVSHELRTPVAVIRANSETLLGGALEDPPAAIRFVQAIERHGERLSSLIDDLLDIAKIEAGRFELEVEEVALEGLAKRCAEGLRERARQGGVEVGLEVAADLRVLADGRALDQVLLNLLENAVRYNAGGGRVTLRARGDGLRVRIEVEDDGPGLPEKEQARLFERFYRVDRGRTRSQRDGGGTGLGLAIVKHLVEAMGGAVGVESTPGEGSTFFVELDQAP